MKRNGYAILIAILVVGGLMFCLAAYDTGGLSARWGWITGTVTDQADLVTAYEAADTVVSNGVVSGYTAADTVVSNALNSSKLSLSGGTMTGDIYMNKSMIWGFGKLKSTGSNLDAPNQGNIGFGAHDASTLMKTNSIGCGVFGTMQGNITFTNTSGSMLMGDIVAGGVNSTEIDIKNCDAALLMLALTDTGGDCSILNTGSASLMMGLADNAIVTNTGDGNLIILNDACGTVNVSGNAGLTIGANVTNTHDNSVVIGSGVKSIADDSVNISGDYYKAGTSLDSYYLEIDGSGAMTGEIDAIDINYSGYVYQDVIYTNTLVGSTNAVIDFTNGNYQAVILTGDCKMWVTNIQSASVTLYVQQDGTGNRLMVYDTSRIDWGDDGEPTLSTAGGDEDVISIIGRSSTKAYCASKGGFTP